MCFSLSEGRESVIDDAIMCGHGSKEEIELYERLSIALELMEDNSFSVENSKIDNGIDFDIITPYPDGLPEKVGALFFNINTAFDVKCEEVNCLNKDPGIMKFQVKIKKY